MPNRMIREGMLESEAILSVPVEARWLFVTIMLSADDVGLFEATEFKLGRRAEVDKGTVGQLLQALSDADLIRLYVVDGKRYGFIPRFNQRVQIKRTKWPMPPQELMGDDSDAINKINNLASNPTVGKPLDNGCAGDGQPPEVEVEVEVEVEEKNLPAFQNPTGSSKPRRRQAATQAKLPTCPFNAIVDTYHEVLPELPRCVVNGDKRVKAVRRVWTWVLTSTKPDKSRRAETAEQGVAWFRTYFGRARENDFLMGRTGRNGDHANWQPDLDFLCTDKGMKQVIEKTQAVAA